MCALSFTKTPLPLPISPPNKKKPWITEIPIFISVRSRIRGEIFLLLVFFAYSDDLVYSARISDTLWALARFTPDVCSLYGGGGGYLQNILDSCFSFGGW